jgi:ribosome recycling factor
MEEVNMKTPNQIYKVMCIPLKEFNSQIELIKNICQHYEINLCLDEHTNELLIYFYDPKSFNAIKQEIQLKVVDVDFNSQPKYVRMSLKMKTPIIDDTPPK